MLSACRTYRDVARAERVAERALAMGPHEGSVYVLLANVYHTVSVKCNIVRMCVSE